MTRLGKRAGECVLVLLTAGGLTACSDGSLSFGGDDDAGSRSDAAVLRLDAGVGNDAGAFDAGNRDAAVTDGGVTPGEDAGYVGLDAGGSGLDGGPTSRDAGITVADAGAPPPDAYVPPPDAGGPVGMDAGLRLDAGPPDAGVRPDSGSPPACDFTLPSLAMADFAGGRNFSRPVYLTHAPGVTDAVFVVEAAGRIQLVRGTTVTTFLDIRTTIGPAPVGGDERGLLGLAFHPGYAANGRFFVMYTPLSSGRNVVAEYHRNASNPDIADTTEVRRLVDITDPETNHNGGMINFGPDGYLYAGTGDGGGGGDGHGAYGNGLNLGVLLGKMLRLDVDATGSGFAAPGNPLAAMGALPQIWAYGLRNPWRWSFDRMTGDMYIADVGQGAIEEVDVQPASSGGGENYGWRAYEGNSVYSAADVPRVPVHTPPIATFPHSGSGLLRGACAIAGGNVYRGSAIPGLRGIYFVGDYCSADVVAMKWCGPGSVATPRRVTGLSGSTLVAWGEDTQGELYMISLGGQISKVVPGP